MWIIGTVAAPVLREAAFTALESWARRQRERAEEIEEESLCFHEQPSFCASELPTTISAASHSSADGEPTQSLPAPHSAVSENAYLARIVHRDNLHRAWRRVSRKKDTTAGVDRQTPRDFAARLHHELERLAFEVGAGKYRLLPLLCWKRHKSGGGHRVIAVPTVRDRVAQGAISQVLELSLDPSLSEWSSSAPRLAWKSFAIHC